MKEDEAYLEIAERFLDSCDRHINHAINIQEVVGFKAYHAFESLGGAFNSHYGRRVPQSHVRKLNEFVANSRHNHQINGHSVASVAMTLRSLRNNCLYPRMLAGTYENPKDQISMTDAKKMVSRVKGILRQVKQIV